jgi:hypothetical protein
MLGSEKYKQFAADCIRIAEKLGCEDKERLLKIADAWTERALEVRGSKRNRATESTSNLSEHHGLRVSISIHEFPRRCFH